MSGIWTDQWLFWVAPLVGALFALLAYELIYFGWRPTVIPVPPETEMLTTGTGSTAMGARDPRMPELTEKMPLGVGDNHNYNHSQLETGLGRDGVANTTGYKQLSTPMRTEGSPATFATPGNGNGNGSVHTVSFMDSFALNNHNNPVQPSVGTVPSPAFARAPAAAAAPTVPGPVAEIVPGV